MARVSYCCCGFSLRTGSLAIGLFYAITGALLSLTCFVLASVVEDVTKTKLESTEGGTYSYFVINIIFGVVAAIQMLVSLSLLYGSYTEKTAYVVPWIIFAAVGYIVMKFGIVYALFSVFSGKAAMVASILVLGIQAAPLLYFLVVVSSYRKSVNEKKTDEALFMSDETSFA